MCLFNSLNTSCVVLPLACCRWGQVFILDALSRYKSRDAREAESIVERVTPRLQHANSAVVLSAVKVIAPPRPLPVTPQLCSSSHCGSRTLSPPPVRVEIPGASKGRAVTGKVWSRCLWPGSQQSIPYPSIP